MNYFLFINQISFKPIKFSVAFALFFVFESKAQIVYHDIVPDVYVCMPEDNLDSTCTGIDAYHEFDIDMNGVQDFIVGGNALLFPCVYGMGPVLEEYVLHFYKSSNNVSLFAVEVAASYGGEYLVRFNYGDTLDNSISYNNNTFCFASYYGWSSNCDKVLFAEAICYTNSFVHRGWSTGIGYVAFLFEINGFFHRGWMQIEVISNHEIILKDYAYNTVRQKAILAGSTVDIYAGIENNLEDQINLSQSDNLYSIELPTELVNKQNKIRIVDVVGRLVQEIAVNSNNIQFDINEPGIFNINIIGNNINWNKKVIVQ